MLSRFRNSYLRCCITYRNYVDYVQGQSPEPRVREYFYYIDHQGMLFLDDARMKNFTSCFKADCCTVIDSKDETDSWALSVQSTDLYITSTNSDRRLDSLITYRDWYKVGQVTKIVARVRIISPSYHSLIIPRTPDRKGGKLKRFEYPESYNSGRYQNDFPYLSICGRERNFVRCDDLPIVFTHVLQKKSDETSLLEDWFSYAHAGDSLMVPFEPEKLCMSVSSGRVYHPASQKLGGVGLVRSKLAIEFSRFFDFENGDDSDPTHFNWNGKRHCLDKQWHKTTSLGKK